MKIRKGSLRISGISLVEVMITISILSVAVIGASAYRYYAALNARKAEANVTAGRVGLLLCESWRGSNGMATYDPVSSFGSDLSITTAEGPGSPIDFNKLGSFNIKIYDVDYYTTLSWKDNNDLSLRALNIVVAWQSANKISNGFDDTNKLFKLTTYTPN